MALITSGCVPSSAIPTLLAHTTLKDGENKTKYTSIFNSTTCADMIDNAGIDSGGVDGSWSDIDTQEFNETICDGLGQYYCDSHEKCSGFFRGLGKKVMNASNHSQWLETTVNGSTKYTFLNHTAASNSTNADTHGIQAFAKDIPWDMSFFVLGAIIAFGAGPHSMDYPPKTMALITSDCGTTRSLSIKWP